MNPLSVQDVLRGAVAPTIVAAALAWLMGRGVASGLGLRYAGAAALAIGTLTGYALLSLGPLQPEAHWHWLPLVLMAGAFLGPLARATGISTLERYSLFAIVSFAAMFVLTPQWEGLQPPRSTHVLLWGALAAVAACSLDAAATRRPGPLLPALLTCTLCAGGVVLALSGNLRFAQILGAAAGSCFGVALVTARPSCATLAAGLALPWTLLAAGTMLSGHLHSFSEVPLASYLLTPAAPACAAIAGGVPLTRGRRISPWGQFAVGLVLCGAAAALAIIADAGGGGGGDW